MAQAQSPLDSPNWMPIAEAHRLLCGLTGNRHMAAKDLTDAMMAEEDDKRVPAMRRCFVPGYRSPPAGAVLLEPDGELLPREYWTEHQLQSWTDATFVTERSNTPASIKGYAYFVWKPALARRWPAAFAPTPSPPATPPADQHQQRRRPGPKPTDDWPEEAKAEIVRIALTDPKAVLNPNYDALNTRIRADFAKANRWLPKDPKETEKIVREFLQRVRGLSPRCLPPNFPLRSYPLVSTRLPMNSHGGRRKWLAPKSPAAKSSPIRRPSPSQNSARRTAFRKACISSSATWALARARWRSARAG